jgi:hypothetical protein
MTRASVVIFACFCLVVCGAMAWLALSPEKLDPFDHSTDGPATMPTSRKFRNPPDGSATSQPTTRRALESVRRSSE